MVVDMLVDWHVDGVWFRHMYDVVLLDFDLVRFLDVLGHELLDFNGNLLLDLLGHQLVDGNGDGLGHLDVYGVRLWHRDLDDLGHRNADRMGHRDSDLLYHLDGNGLGVLDGVRGDFVVLGAAVLRRGVEGFFAAASTSSSADFVAADIAARFVATSITGAAGGHGQGQEEGKALQKVG